ncbi:MAG: TetR/AcrR family transcriptional regulator [Thermomicrobiales bacterium]
MSESEGRERVLREAHELFLDRGFAEISMQQIADAAGMTKASLYYHFLNKEDLFAQVVRREGERLLTGVTAELDGIDSFEEQLNRVAMFIFRATKTDIARMISDYRQHVSEDFQRRTRENVGDLNPSQYLRPYFERAAAAGELRSVDVTVAIGLFFAMIVGMLKFSEHNPAIHVGDDLAVQIVDIFLRGVSARGGA